MNGYGYGRGGGFLSSIPPFVKFVLITNVVVYLLFNLLFANFSIGGAPLALYIQKIFALIPFDYESSYFLPWQLVTYQFLHGGFSHIFFNMFGIWIFGAELERDWGSARFGVFYLLSGIGAGLLQIFVSDLPTVGASGALFGILIAYGMLYPNRKLLIFPLFIPVAAKYLVAFYAAIELFRGISGANTGVAHWAHLAGGLTGFLLLKFGKDIGVWKLANKWFGTKGIQSGGYSSEGFGLGGGSFGGGSSYGDSYGQSSSSGGSPFSRLKMKVNKEQPQTYTPAPKAEKTFDIDGETIDQSKIDEILDKISAGGYQSLTDKEKYILTELSKRI